MALSEKARKAKNAYQREWRRRNPEKIKEYTKRHWERMAERLEKEDDTASAEDENV